MGSQCSLLPIMKMKMYLTPVPRRLVVTLCGRMSKWKREAKSLLFWQRPQVVRTLMPLSVVINFLKGLTETVDSFFNNINNINNLLTNIPHHQLFPLLDRVIIHLSQQDVQYSTRDEVYRVALVDQRKHLADTFKPVFESDSCFEHGNTLHQQYYEALVTFRASLADVWRLSASCQATHDLAIETWNRERSSHSETCHAEMVRK